MSFWGWIFGDDAPLPVKPVVEPVTLVSWCWTGTHWTGRHPSPINLDLRFSDGSRYVDAHRYPSGEGVNTSTYNWLLMFAKQIEWGQHADKEMQA